MNEAFDVSIPNVYRLFSVSEMKIASSSLLVERYGHAGRSFEMSERLVTEVSGYHDCSG